jgi:transcription initiation factor TFIID subunit 1
MDLQAIRDRIQKKGYTGREDFLADMALIKENSVLYNGPDDLLSHNASKLLDHVFKLFSENEERLMHLEKAINPLLDDNDQVALTYMFKNLLDERIKNMQESWPFAKPVNRDGIHQYFYNVSIFFLSFF